MPMRRQNWTPIDTQYPGPENSTICWCTSKRGFSANAAFTGAKAASKLFSLNGELMSLEGKTLFITGASRGIGLSIGLRAAGDGANVAIAAKTETPHPKLEGTIYTAAEQIEKAGGQALPLVVDVRDEAAVKGAIDKTAARFGSLDIVVNNASAISLTPVTHT